MVSRWTAETSWTSRLKNEQAVELVVLRIGSGGVKLVFIDETENSKHLPDFYAVCAVAVDATKYALLKDAVDNALKKCGWCSDFEFKGSWIFSSSKGDKSVSTEQRVDAAKSMVAATTSDKNARVKCVMAWTDQGGGQEQHLKLVSQAVKKSLPQASEQGKGKNLVAVFADRKDGISRKNLSDAIVKVTESRGYSIVEDVVVVPSSCKWRGIVLADIFAYLGMWVYAGVRSKSTQLSLLDGEIKVTDSLLKKMASVQEVLSTGAGFHFVPRLRTAAG